VAKRTKRGNIGSPQSLVHFDPPKLTPLGPAQTFAKEAWASGKHLVFHGYPKTGKTHFGLALALSSVLGPRRQDKIIIVRSAVPSRDIGFLGGKTEADKVEIYQRPYIDIVTSLCGRGDAWRLLALHDKIEFFSTSFLRGITWTNAVVLVDEAQNLSDMELHTTLTRIGNNCRLIVTGDMEQNDLIALRQQSGLPTALDVLSSMPGVNLIEFGIDDILGSEFVRTYMSARKKVMSAS
jgi:phosphate starvation-inducible protein PhoH